MPRTWWLAASLPLVAACASGQAHPAAQVQTPAPAGAPESTSVNRAQYPSTYHRHTNPPVLIRNATIMTATGQVISNGAILLRDGRIVAVGATVTAPADATVVDGTGKFVTPGIIDDHSHLGVYAAPGTP